MRAAALSLAAGLLGSAQAAIVGHCGDIDTDETWSASHYHVLECPVFVKDGATLTIDAGTNIFANKVSCTSTLSAMSPASVACIPCGYSLCSCLHQPHV